MVHRSIADLALNQVQGPAHSVLRTPGDLSRGGPQRLFINLSLTAPMAVRQRGREVHADAGSLLVFDSGEPFELDAAGAVNLLSLAVPHAALRRAAAAGDAFRPRCLGPGAPAVLLTGQMRALAQWPHDLGANEAASVGDAMLGLLAAALADGSPGAAPRPGALGGRLQALIARHHGDPAFNPARAAHELGISVRTLHAWLARDGCRFGALLLQHRLERARALLTGAAAGACTVAEVAARCGFVSPAHFCRRFRERFGVAPSGMLRRH